MSRSGCRTLIDSKPPRAGQACFFGGLCRSLTRMPWKQPARLSGADSPKAGLGSLGWFKPWHAKHTSSGLCTAARRAQDGLQQLLAQRCVVPSCPAQVPLSRQRSSTNQRSCIPSTCVLLYLAANQPSSAAPCQRGSRLQPAQQPLRHQQQHTPRPMLAEVPAEPHTRGCGHCQHATTWIEARCHGQHVVPSYLLGQLLEPQCGASERQAPSSASCGWPCHQTILSLTPSRIHHSGRFSSSCLAISLTVCWATIRSSTDPARLCMASRALRLL